MATGEELSMQGDKYLGTPYSEMDCQAFWERCLRDVGIRKDLAGSNAWIREMMTHGWVGSPEECKARFGKIPLGAALFILEFDGKEPAKYRGDGVGNASHIGMYIGREEGAIHSSSSRGCVAYSKFKGKSINGGWDRVGLWDQIDYGTGGGGGGIKMVTISGGNTDYPIHMRTSATRESKILMDIPQGSQAELVRNDGAWDKITYEGQTGYVMHEFVHEASGGSEDDGKIVPDDMIQVERRKLQDIYAIIGDWLTRG